MVPYFYTSLSLVALIFHEWQQFHKSCSLSVFILYPLCRKKTSDKVLVLSHILPQSFIFGRKKLNRLFFPDFLWTAFFSSIEEEQGNCAFDE
jgi:hypothetical protein